MYFLSHQLRLWSHVSQFDIHFSISALVPIPQHIKAQRNASCLLFLPSLGISAISRIYYFQINWLFNLRFLHYCCFCSSPSCGFFLVSAVILFVSDLAVLGLLLSVCCCFLVFCVAVSVLWLYLDRWMLDNSSRIVLGTCKSTAIVHAGLWVTASSSCLIKICKIETAGADQHLQSTCPGWGLGDVPGSMGLKSQTHLNLCPHQVFACHAVITLVIPCVTGPYTVSTRQLVHSLDC